MRRVWDISSRGPGSALSRFGATGLMVGVVLCALVAAGCSDGAPDAAAQSGPVKLVFASGRDPLGVVDSFYEECADMSEGRYEVEQLVLPPAVDGQREQMIRRLAAGDDSLDILGLDVIWTAEFARAGWLYDLTPHVAAIEDEFVPASFGTVKYDGSIWAVPHNTNVAMLYYRTDIVDTPPETWQELRAMVEAEQERDPDQAGFIWQSNEYEGFTVDVLEFLFGAGAEILDPDGLDSPLADTEAATEVFTFMRGLYADGITPRSVSTFQEEESRLFFQEGNGMFLRNWPYAYELMNSGETKIKGKIGTAPLPAWEGGERAGVLGGLNWGVSAYSRYPELAAELIQCVTREENQLRLALEKTELPVRLAVYDDPRVKEKMPFIDVSRESLETARERPVTPYYNDVTVAIANQAHRVITGSVDPAEAVQALDESITLAVNGEGEI